MIVVKLLTRRPVQQNICSMQRNKKETQCLGVHPSALSLFISVNHNREQTFSFLLSFHPIHKPFVKLTDYLGGLTFFLKYLRDFHPLCSTSNHPRTPNYYVRLFISCLHTYIPQSQISACGGRTLSDWTYPFCVELTAIGFCLTSLPCIYIIAWVLLFVNTFFKIFYSVSVDKYRRTPNLIQWRGRTP